MGDNQYPLKEYHAEMHRNLRQAVKTINRQLEENSLPEPYENIISFSDDEFIKHVAQEDLKFFDYFKNKDNMLGKYFLGRRCGIQSASGELLGSGKVESIAKNDVVISNTTGLPLPLNINDSLKISTFSDQQEAQAFTANVYQHDSEIIRLFNAVAIMAANQRMNFRISTNIQATLQYEKETFRVNILDVSSGGLMVESGKPLALHKVVLIKFTLQNYRFEEHCIVTRAIGGDEAANTYGIKFISLSSSVSDKLNSFIFQQQAIARRKGGNDPT